MTFMVTRTTISSQISTYLQYFYSEAFCYALAIKKGTLTKKINLNQLIDIFFKEAIRW